MHRSSPRTVLTALLVVAVLLFAQILGLHHHRHLELDGSAPEHAMQLHFEDAGIHANEADAGHAHAAQGDVASHAHLDIETKAISDGLSKVFADELPLALLLLVLVLRLPGRQIQAPRALVPEPWRRHPRHAVLPPSHAPPLILA